MARLVAMEDSAERGQYADLQWFYHHMERSDVTIQSAMSRRLAFIDAVDWEIRQVENADPTLANEQADFLRYAYDRIANVKEASRFLGAALFRGFSHLEKSYTGYGNLATACRWAVSIPSKSCFDFPKKTSAFSTPDAKFISR